LEEINAGFDALRSIVADQWINNIHESLFFVWLEAEYDKPQVYGG